MGISQNRGYHLGGPHNKDYSILGSTTCTYDHLYIPFLHSILTSKLKLWVSEGLSRDLGIQLSTKYSECFPGNQRAWVPIWEYVPPWSVGNPRYLNGIPYFGKPQPCMYLYNTIYHFILYFLFNFHYSGDIPVILTLAHLGRCKVAQLGSGFRGVVRA